MTALFVGSVGTMMSGCKLTCFGFSRLQCATQAATLTEQLCHPCAAHEYANCESNSARDDQSDAQRQVHLHERQFNLHRLRVERRKYQCSEHREQQQGEKSFAS